MTVSINKINAGFDKSFLPAVLSLATEREEYFVSPDRHCAVGKSRGGREIRVEIQGDVLSLTATLDGSQVFAAHLLTRIAALCPRDLTVVGTLGGESVTVTPIAGVSPATCAANVVEELCNSYNADCDPVESAWRLTEGWLKADTFAAHPAFQSRIDATLRLWSE